MVLRKSAKLSPTATEKNEGLKKIPKAAKKSLIIKNSRMLLAKAAPKLAEKSKIDSTFKYQRATIKEKRAYISGLKDNIAKLSDSACHEALAIILFQAGRRRGDAIDDLMLELSKSPFREKKELFKKYKKLFTFDPADKKYRIKTNSSRKQLLEFVIDVKLVTVLPKLEKLLAENVKTAILMEHGMPNRKFQPLKRLIIRRWKKKDGKGIDLFLGENNKVNIQEFSLVPILEGNPRGLSFNIVNIFNDYLNKLKTAKQNPSLSKWKNNDRLVVFLGEPSICEALRLVTSHGDTTKSKRLTKELMAKMIKVLKEIKKLTPQGIHIYMPPLSRGRVAALNNDYGFKTNPNEFPEIFKKIFDQAGVNYSVVNYRKF